MPWGGESSNNKPAVRARPFPADPCTRATPPLLAYPPHGPRRDAAFWPQARIQLQLRIHHQIPIRVDQSTHTSDIAIVHSGALKSNFNPSKCRPSNAATPLHQHPSPLPPKPQPQSPIPRHKMRHRSSAAYGRNTSSRRRNGRSCSMHSWASWS